MNVRPFPEGLLSEPFAGPKLTGLSNCPFSPQLSPILIAIVPTLVRASILILIHPSLAAEEGGTAALRMDILLKVAQFSSLLAFPITAVSMAIVQQYHKDAAVTALILLFWDAIQCCREIHVQDMKNFHNSGAVYTACGSK